MFCLGLLLYCSPQMWAGEERTSQLSFHKGSLISRDVKNTMLCDFIHKFIVMLCYVFKETEAL